MEHFLKEELRVSSGGGALLNMDSQKAQMEPGRPAQGATESFSRLPTKKPVDLNFEALTYDVTTGFRRERKQILHGVSGRFPARQLVAILGPSGAGKSSLLDILSGYRLTGVSGKVCVNRQERDLAAFRRKSCYITQEDRLQPLLTLRENMMIAAGLKLRDVTHADKSLIIGEILSTLGLTDNENTRTALLSGGQKKRLSIALELINNPSVMFLDEPTTGLDSSSCTQCVSLLKLLARQGRTIVCTVHQPSASLFHLFDQVYVLARGLCLYQGAPDQLVPYLSNVSLPCPMYHNPADYVIELACGEYGEDKIERLVEAVDNGAISKWSSPDLVVENIAPPVKEVSKKDEKKKSSTRSRRSSQNTSQWNQICLLLQRGFIKVKRDQTLTHMRLVVNILVGFMLGGLYISSGNDGSRMLDNYALMFGILIHHMMSTMMLTILTFPQELAILKKEHFNRWYSLKSYFISVTIVDIPVAVLSCLLFSVIVYFLSGQPCDVTRFTMFCAVSVLIVFVAQSVGLMIGAVFNVVNGTFLGPTMNVPMMMFAGFGVTLRDLPPYLQWGSYVSYLRYGLEGYVGAIYGMNRPTLDCPPLEFCNYKYPEKFLRDIDMKGDQFWTDVAALGSILVITRILAYFLLRWKLGSMR